jgi:leucyl aminopeptidase
MRLMKKDMGGAAAVLGLAMWASETEYPRDMDFYLALAENSVDAKSFRPSDVFTARNGMKVEIHNTDAEGRLVLADVMDVAVTQKGKDEPAMIIDIATLTGAIKVALGADIAGLFSNHDGLAEELNMAGFQRGDLNWRMPLFGKYTASFSSPFADMVNAVDGFGGAITAALFLEKFTRQKPWAHLDIYAWADKASGALASSGGSGQAVQALVRFIQASDF